MTHPVAVTSLATAGQRIDSKSQKSGKGAEHESSYLQTLAREETQAGCGARGAGRGHVAGPGRVGRGCFGRIRRVGRGGRLHGQTRRPGAAIRPAAPDPPDRGKRDQRQPQQGDGAAAAVPGDGVRGHAARREGLVRAAGCLRRRAGARPGRQLRAQAGQHRDRRPGRGADRDADQPVTPAEPVRARGGELRRRAELRPDPDRGTGARPGSR